MRGPSLDFLQESALPVERTIGFVSDGNINGVGSASGVLEVVVLANLVDGRALEEATSAVGLHDGAVLVIDSQFLGRACEAQEIIGELGKTRTDCWARSGCVWANSGRVLNSLVSFLVWTDEFRSTHKDVVAVISLELAT